MIDYVTTDDLRAALAPLPTREEIFARFPTREEMREEIRAARVPYATREEMYQLVREEGERTRRHFDVIAERLRDDIRMLAEGLVALHRRIEDVRTELRADIAALDRRVMRLEVVRGI